MITVYSCRCVKQFTLTDLNFNYIVVKIRHCVSVESCLSDWSVGGITVKSNDIKPDSVFESTNVVSRWALQEIAQCNGNFPWCFLFEPGQDKQSKTSICSL